MKSQKNLEQNNKSRIIKFLFPLYPLKTFKSLRILLVLASLIALRLILGKIGIRLPATNQTISFAWVPLMFAGWYFGPILGFFIGAITDTLSFLFSPGSLWFFLFAIQEPLVGMLSGIFSGIYNLRIDKKSQVFDLVFQQVIYIGFTFVSLFLIFYFVNYSNQIFIDGKLNHSLVNVYKWVAIGLLTTFFIVVEVYTIIYQFNLKKNKKSKQHFTCFIYVSCLVVLAMLLFSFVLGPIASNQYYIYVYKITNPNVLTYGLMYYLIPRVVVQSIKIPFEATVLFLTIIASNNQLMNIVQNENNKWN